MPRHVENQMQPDFNKCQRLYPQLSIATCPDYDRKYKVSLKKRFSPDRTFTATRTYSSTIGTAKAQSCSIARL